MPEMRFSSVDFPDPDGPMKATKCPAGIASDTRSNAWTSSTPRTYRRDTSRMTMSAASGPMRARIVTHGRRRSYGTAGRAAFGPYAGLRAVGLGRARLLLLPHHEHLLTVHLDGAPVTRRFALRLGSSALAPLPQLLLQVLEHLSSRRRDAGGASSR